MIPGSLFISSSNGVLISDHDLKLELGNRAADFWQHLAQRTLNATQFDDLFFLSNLRRKAKAAGFANDLAPPTPRFASVLRLAIIGGYSLYPLHLLIEHVLEVSGIRVEVFVGEYDNYASEILDAASELHRFKPELVFLLPSAQRCRYAGGLADPLPVQKDNVAVTARALLGLAKSLHEQTAAEVLLANFILPSQFDPGLIRTRTLASDWAFRKAVNTELGLQAPPFVHVCDLEFLAYRKGARAVRDDRSWLESKQPFSPDFMVDVVLEVRHTILGLYQSAKKVLVLDLDGTLWGGVIGDDGVEGIELGDTTARGQAFKEFQKYILGLKDRGILLAVCSKNDQAKAAEPFERHPEMVLRLEHFVAFKANWGPKSDNIKAIAAELNLGLDSFVFVDDNPAEIEIVRQFTPAVATILLGADPSDYLQTLQDCRYFEQRTVTAEDQQRTEQYRQEAQRKNLQTAITDLPTYLESLEMTAELREFNQADAPRISQLIGKSNQFNLTTRRRTEAEVLGLIDSPRFAGFSLRLADRFGDHGLVAVVLCEELEGKIFEVDTWLMSCRVLSRQAEEEVLNEILRLARGRGLRLVVGKYIATAKNKMVADLYSKMGFKLTSDTADGRIFELPVQDFKPIATKIKVLRRSHESG